MEEVRVYVFSSSSVTNIWAGYGARMWAVSKGESETAFKGKRTKAAKISSGSFGLLYCEPWQAFTVPFVFRSKPQTEFSEREVWDGEWFLPFAITPLGSPRSRLQGEDIKKLPGAARRGITNFSHYLRVQGNFAFQESLVAEQDWEKIVEKLSS